jgi:hypothetical protein
MTVKPICAICLEMMEEGATYKTRACIVFCTSCMNEGYEKLRKVRPGLEGYEHGIKCPMCRRFAKMKVRKYVPPPSRCPNTWWEKIETSLGVTTQGMKHYVVAFLSGGAAMAAVGPAGIILTAAWPPEWVLVGAGVIGAGACALFVYTTRAKPKN